MTDPGYWEQSYPPSVFGGGGGGGGGGEITPLGTWHALVPDGDIGTPPDGNLVWMSSGTPAGPLNINKSNAAGTPYGAVLLAMVEGDILTITGGGATLTWTLGMVSDAGANVAVLGDTSGALPPTPLDVEVTITKGSGGGRAVPAETEQEQPPPRPDPREKGDK